ncbi:hypothetical protein Fmac_033030 [Flemingia macrophylla]|uniref:Uncharacterized protein n=1 Tax=Flemingia macrophylla TaxID=520843 RepID=A0ABD1L6L9_9FABA
MISDDGELMAQQILSPLFDSRSDGMKFSNISGGSKKSRAKWLAEVSNRMALLH